MRKLSVALLCFWSIAHASVQTCFTPQQDCTRKIVAAINRASTSIDVQAYGFTSMPILNALAQAENRGVKVDVLLDKVDVSRRYAVTAFLTNNQIPFLIDYKPAIAHNKVMIIDGREVITGSFNFTKAAQYKNAENVIIERSIMVSQRYLDNFVYRKSLSESLADYQKKS